MYILSCRLFQFLGSSECKTMIEIFDQYDNWKDGMVGLLCPPCQDEPA